MVDDEDDGDGDSSSSERATGECPRARRARERLVEVGYSTKRDRTNLLSNRGCGAPASLPHYSSSAVVVCNLFILRHLLWKSSAIWNSRLEHTCALHKKTSESLTGITCRRQTSRRTTNKNTKASTIPSGPIQIHHSKLPDIYPHRARPVFRPRRVMIMIMACTLPRPRPQYIQRADPS